MSVKILHLADLHIGYSPGFLNQEKARVRAEDFKSAFQRAVDFALNPENAVKAAIIAGDLFDCYAPEETVRGFVRAQLGRLSNASIHTLVIPGTHDTIAFPDSVYKKESFPAGVHVLAEPFSTAPLELALNGEKFYFYWLTYEPGEKRTVVEYLLSVKAGLPGDGYKVFVAHASLKGSPEWGMRRKDLPVSVEDLLSSGMDYVALGHYHGFFESPQGESLPGQTKVVYPGTLEGKAFGENGPRYLVVATFENNRVRVEKHLFNKRVLEEKVMSLDSEQFPNEEELLKSLEGLGNDNLLLKLTLTGSPVFMVRPDYLTQALADRFFHVEIEDATSLLSSLSVDEILHERTIRGMFVRKLKETIAALQESNEPVTEESARPTPGKTGVDKTASDRVASEGVGLDGIASQRAICEMALKEGLIAFAEKGIVTQARKE